MTRPRIESGKQSAMIVGAAGPYPPSPTPTRRRMANKNAQVVANPDPAVAALQRMTPSTIITQRENRSATHPKIRELTMLLHRNLLPNDPLNNSTSGSFVVM